MFLSISKVKVSNQPKIHDKSKNNFFTPYLLVIFIIIGTLALIALIYINKDKIARLFSRFRNRGPDGGG